MTASGTDGGQVAVVTGAASGIGAAVARRLVDDGWRVTLTDRDPGVQDAAAGLGTGVVAVTADVTVAADWDRVADAARGLGPVALFVGNAVRQVVAPVTELADADWDAQMDVNVKGSFLGLKVLLPDLVATRGSVVLVSSVHALVGLPGHPAYAASKAALAALARQVAVDYAPVRANCVLPGPVLTPAWDRVPEADRLRSVEQTALRRFGDPAEVAGVVSFLGSSDASFVTGASIVVDGGWSVTKDSA